MPFGLTNAPATFQQLMNEVFQKRLRKGVLVFFDRHIGVQLKYGWRDEHVVLLEEVLQTLRSNQLYAKLSKCSFGVKQVDYLGYVISEAGVSGHRPKQNRGDATMANPEKH
jgi:hypothetical protein